MSEIKYIKLTKAETLQAILEAMESGAVIVGGVYVDRIGGGEKESHHFEPLSTAHKIGWIDHCYRKEIN